MENSSSDEREEVDEVEEVVEQRNVRQRMPSTLNGRIKRASTIDSCDNG